MTSQEKNKSMPIYVKIGIALIVLYLTWHSVVRFNFYRLTINISAKVGDLLPVEIKPVLNINGESINLGYAEFILPKIHPFKLVKGKEELELAVHGNDFSIFFNSPIEINPGQFNNYFLENNLSILNDENETAKQVSKINADSLEASKVSTGIGGDYRWLLYCLNTKPKKLIEILFSSRKTLDLYLFKMNYKKAFEEFRSIVNLETSHINAFVFLNRKPQLVGNLFIKVFSKNGKISQIILIKSNSEILSKGLMLKVLSTYQLRVEDISDKANVRKLIGDALGPVKVKANE